MAIRIWVTSSKEDLQLCSAVKIDTLLVPVGTTENSPGRESWVHGPHHCPVPEGRKNKPDSVVPPGLLGEWEPLPRTYGLGYFLSSLPGLGNAILSARADFILSGSTQCRRLR